MTGDLQPDLEPVFQVQLLKRVNAVRQHTRIGVRRILEDIQRNGGLPTAKARLCALFVHADDFFQATERIGRLDLSIEAMALEDKWKPLFTQEELDSAASRLAQHGFGPMLEGRPGSNRTGMELQKFESPFSQMELRGSENISLLQIVARESQTPCEFTSAHSAALHQGTRLAVSSFIRKHFTDCADCRRRYSDVLATYSRFDREALGIWVALVNTFRTSLLILLR